MLVVCEKIVWLRLLCWLHMFMLAVLPIDLVMMPFYLIFNYVDSSGNLLA